MFHIQIYGGGNGGRGERALNCYGIHAYTNSHTVREKPFKCELYMNFPIISVGSFLVPCLT